MEGKNVPPEALMLPLSGTTGVTFFVRSAFIDSSMFQVTAEWPRTSVLTLTRIAARTQAGGIDKDGRGSRSGKGVGVCFSFGEGEERDVGKTPICWCWSSARPRLS